MRERNVAFLEYPARWRELENPAPKGGTGSGLPPRCSQVSPWPDQPCRDSKPSGALLASRRARLQEVIQKGIGTTTPHDTSEKRYRLPLFAGSFDWHSAVHAHWALLAMARVHKDDALERWITGRLTDKALTAEADFLAKTPDFELPYGRAWLVLLLKELTARGRSSKAIAALQKQALDAVLSWLEKSPYPELTSRKPPGLIATHDSWLFAYLLVALSKPASKDVLARLSALRTKRMAPVRAQVSTHVHVPADFLYLPAVQALIDRVDPGATGTPAAYPPGTSPPFADPPLTTANAHSAGAMVVRIWPHAVDAQKGDEKACSRFHARMNELFARPDQWGDSFEHVSHWVPQFMWMALWLEAGRP